MDKAKIEHLVGFVEDEDFEFTQAECALVDEIEQPSRSRHQHVEAARNGADALLVGYAAEDDSDRKPHEPAIGFGACRDLRRELAGRCRYKHADVAGLGEATTDGEPIERWKHEGSGLAGTGLGNSEQVAPGKNSGDRLPLDRSRLRIILRGERIEQGLREPRDMNDIEQIPILCARPAPEGASRERGRKSAPRE